MTLTISTDRDDIINIGDYDTKLTYDEYHNREITIPTSSISGATGQTIITLTFEQCYRDIYSQSLF
ncbi:MAG: hypothetical protein GXO60_09695 [Epsilonproteobacteria bacterium]|nr:hypothetical protein [Campylobacterota bacterium]